MSPYTPAPRVQFAFGVGPLDDPSADWVTLDDDGITIESINVDRGRDSEFDDFPASKCQMVIKDTDRILDPSNASGPYFGDLKPRVWVRAQGYINPTAYDRFTGFVDGWPVKNGRGLTTVNLTATDGQKILASKRLPQSVYETVVLADSPVGYWRMSEATGGVLADISGNQNDGTWGPNARRNEAPVVPYSGDASAKSSVANTIVAQIDNAATILPDMLEWTVEFWFQSDDDTGGDASNRFIDGDTVGSTRGFRIVGYGGAASAYGGEIIVRPFDDAYTSYFTAPVFDALPHHIVVAYNGSSFGGNLAVYVDGANVGVREIVFSTTVTGDTGKFVIGPRFGGSDILSGRIDDVAIYDTFLSASQIAAHYEAGANPWDGDSTGARIERILDLIGWPAAMRAIDTGEMVLGPANIAGRTALDYIKSCAASEQGRLFVDASGRITFHQRDRFLTTATETTSQLTFSDDGAGDSIYAGLNFTFDEQKIVNGADVTRDGGSPQHAEDASSQAGYGPLERSVGGLLLAHDRNSRQIAEYLVFRYATPQERAEGWSIQPELDSSSWADIFGLEIGHRVTLECTPANVGSQKVLDQHIERIADAITPESWTVEFNGSSVDDSAYLFWGSGLWGTGVWR